MAGRPNPLAEPEFAKAVAEAFVAGASRQQMCELFGVKDKATITRWRRDSRVKALALKLVEDRVLQITRKVDATIEGRLEYADKMSVRELLDIRKEFLGGALRTQTEKADEATVTQAIEALEENPDLADDLAKLVNSAQE